MLASRYGVGNTGRVVRVMRLVAMVLVSLRAGAPLASADSPGESLPSRGIVLVLPAPDAISVSEQLAAIARWTRDYQAWRAWFEEWRNRREPGWMGIRPRRPRPDPPASLAAACPVPEESGLLSDACRLLEEWRNNDVAVTLITQQVTTARAQKEAPQRSVWWQHVHLDALWPMTQAGSGVFGLVGLHATIDVHGRVQVFVAPGAILMRAPGVSGQQWQPATDWGFSYRVIDFTVPRWRRPATLHVNVARVWPLGRAEHVPAFQSDMYLAGLSLTFRKAPGSDARPLSLRGHGEFLGR